MKKCCDNCEEIVFLTDDGYCRRCGKHADNMKPKKDVSRCRECGCYYEVNETNDWTTCKQECSDKYVAYLQKVANEAQRELYARNQ